MYMRFIWSLQSWNSDFTSKDDTLKAEVLRACKVIYNHYCYKFWEGKSQLFQQMFPESAIAKNFKYEEHKCAFLVLFDLAPYFQVSASSKLNKILVCLFDDNPNRNMQTKQMDIPVLAWHPKAG